MFQRNLKYYRLKNNMTKTELASRVGVSTMAVSNYESGKRRPDMATINALADALGVRVVDFISSRNKDLVFTHAEFRKRSSLTKTEQEYVRETVEEYFNRFYTVVELLGGDVLAPVPALHSLELSDDVEVNAANLREWLGFSKTGPVSDLIGVLENHGILVCLLDVSNDGFDGINGDINGRPYVAVKEKMTDERKRTTIAHELAHAAFRWPAGLDSKDIEKTAQAIAGAFLFPENDALRELGLRRQTLTTDLFMVCEEYGISMSLLVVRAHVLGIINDAVYRRFFITNREGFMVSPSRPEVPKLFEQLVYRAVNEGEISVHKGAELLKLPYDEVDKNCRQVDVL